MVMLDYKMGKGVKNLEKLITKYVNAPNMSFVNFYQSKLYCFYLKSFDLM